MLEFKSNNKLILAVVSRGHSRAKENEQARLWKFRDRLEGLNVRIRTEDLQGSYIKEPSTEPRKRTTYFNDKPEC